MKHDRIRSVARRRQRRTSNVKNTLTNGVPINVPLFDFTNVDMEQCELKLINRDLGDCQPGPSGHNVPSKVQGERAKLKRVGHLSLITAAYEGDTENVQQVYWTKKTALGTDSDGLEHLQTELNNAFIQSVMARNCVMARLLLDLGASPNGFHPTYPALLYVIHPRSEDILDLLIERGVSFCCKDYTESTILHTAARVGDGKIMKKMLDLNEVDVNVVADNRRQVTPLHIAVEYNRYDCARLLIEAGADVNVTDYKGMTPLHMAAIRGNYVLITRLLNKGADLNIQDNDSYLPWLYALQYGHMSTMQLLEQHMDVLTIANTRSKHGGTFLHIAVQFGNTSAIKYLIEKGCGLKDVDSDGQTVLMYAVNDNSIQLPHVVKFLLEYESCAQTINYVDNMGRTAFFTLMHSTNFGTSQKLIGKYLIQAGANIDVCDANGHSLLVEYLVYEERRQFLCDNGADINFLGADGTSILWKSATQHESSNCLRYFLDRNIDMGLSYHRESYSDATPLLSALEQNNIYMAKELLYSDCSLDGVSQFLASSTAQERLRDSTEFRDFVATIQNSALLNSPQSLWKQARIATLRAVGPGPVEPKVDSLGLPAVIAKLMNPSTYRQYNESILRI